MDARHALFRFDGRLRRRDWWLWSIAMAIAWYVVSDGSAALLGLDDYVFSGGGRAAVFGDPVLPLVHSLAVTLLFLWPQMALTVKRAHDRARPAWLAVGVSLAATALGWWPVESYEASGAALDGGDLAGGLGLIAGLLSAGCGLYLLVVLGFLDGTPGPNRFGRSPKGLGGDPADVAAEVFS